MANFFYTALFISFQALLVPLVHTHGHSNVCRSYCGNLTIDYPFAVQPGCGHPGYRDLLFCINDVLMFHISSGSYRVLDIDYAYLSLTLHDPHLSNCDSIVLGGRGNGFVVEHWRAPYLNPTADNVFMLIGCSSQSSLFQGFPGKHLPCRNVSGMGCEAYYGCRAWDQIWLRRASAVYGSGPPSCCAVPYDAVKSVNLSRLDCQGYSSAYSLAPLRVGGPEVWAYGIRVKYSVEITNDSFCKACEATSGSCGYDPNGFGQLCMCESWNSTSNCDSELSLSNQGTWSWTITLADRYVNGNGWLWNQNIGDRGRGGDCGSPAGRRRHHVEEEEQNQHESEDQQSPVQLNENNGKGGQKQQDNCEGQQQQNDDQEEEPITGADNCEEQQQQQQQKDDQDEEPTRVPKEGHGIISNPNARPPPRA